MCCNILKLITFSIYQIESRSKNNSKYHLIVDFLKLRERFLMYKIRKQLLKRHWYNI